MYTHKKLKVWREIEEENKIINKECLHSYVNAVLPWRTEDPPPPPRGVGPGALRIPKWEKLEYCNTIKIILYNFVISFYKNL